MGYNCDISGIGLFCYFLGVGSYTRVEFLLVFYFIRSSEQGFFGASFYLLVPALCQFFDNRVSSFFFLSSLFFSYFKFLWFT